MSPTLNRLFLKSSTIIAALFLLFLPVRPIFALDPSLEVRCCWAIQEGRTSIDECSELELTAERCAEVLKDWDKTQKAWLIQTSLEYKIIPVVIVVLIVVAIWYIKKKKSQ